jgi:hypothetical protein
MLDERKRTISELVVDLAILTIHQCGILDSVCTKIVLKEAFEIIRPSQSAFTTIFFLENGKKGR